MKRFLVKFLSLSNISHLTLRDRIAQLPHEDPKVRTILYRIAHIGRSDQSESAWGRQGIRTAVRQRRRVLRDANRDHRYKAEYEGRA